MADQTKSPADVLADHMRDLRDSAAELRKDFPLLVELADEFELAAAELEPVLAALRAVPDWATNPTSEMLAAGRAAVMAERCSNPNWTPRQHYAASGRSTAGIPEDVLDERGPLTKESVAVMVFGAMVAHRPGQMP